MGDVLWAILEESLQSSLNRGSQNISQSLGVPIQHFWLTITDFDRDEYQKYDLEHKIRETFVSALQEEFADYGLT